MTTPNYNDGLWHGWNGGECPVHPETKLEAVLLDITSPRNPYGPHSTMETSARALSPCWGATKEFRQVIAFRVTKERREPRSFWTVGIHKFVEREHAIDFAENRGGVVVEYREVME